MSNVEKTNAEGISKKQMPKRECRKSNVHGIIHVNDRSTNHLARVACTLCPLSPSSTFETS